MKKLEMTDFEKTFLSKIKENNEEIGGVQVSKNKITFTVTNVTKRVNTRLRYKNPSEEFVRIIKDLSWS